MLESDRLRSGIATLHIVDILNWKAITSGLAVNPFFTNSSLANDDDPTPKTELPNHHSQSLPRFNALVNEFPV